MNCMSLSLSTIYIFEHLLAAFYSLSVTSSCKLLNLITNGAVSIVSGHKSGALVSFPEMLL